jgi:hypothetical protein
VLVAQVVFGFIFFACGLISLFKLLLSFFLRWTLSLILSFYDMAYPAENPPGYDYVVPPRVFAPIPHSGPRHFLGDDRSVFAPGTPEWNNSRTNLVFAAPPRYEGDGLGQQAGKGQGRWKKLCGRFWRRGGTRQGA